MKKYKVGKTIQEINQKIKSGDVVVVTAEEIIDIVKNEGTCRGCTPGGCGDYRNLCPHVFVGCVYQFRPFGSHHQGFQGVVE